MASDTTTVPAAGAGAAAAVEAYLQAKATPAQLDDARRLSQLMSRVTGAEPVMWGPSIVGFGTYRYTYASGRSGTSSLVGFAVRGKEFALYLAPDWPDADGWLSRLGKAKPGKGCLYVKQLADVDVDVLEQMVAASVAELRRRYPDQGAG